MAYSETKVVLGGLAHIPIIIGFFYLIKRQYSLGAVLRTGKNALSDKVKSSSVKASSTTKPAAAKASSTAKPVAAKPASTAKPVAAKASSTAKPADTKAASTPQPSAAKATTSNTSASAVNSPATSKSVTESTSPLPTKALASKKPHEDVPVNTYKPKAPFTGTVTENYSALKEGAIGKVQHITFDISKVMC